MQVNVEEEREYSMWNVKIGTRDRKKGKSEREMEERRKDGDFFKVME